MSIVIATDFSAYNIPAHYNYTIIYRDRKKLSYQCLNLAHSHSSLNFYTCLAYPEVLINNNTFFERGLADSINMVQGQAAPPA